MAKKRVGRYPKEFRRMAVERLKNCDNILALSRELGVHRRLLYKWRDQLEPVDVPKESLPQNSREFILRKEVHQLKRLLAEKTMEVDFFKGALLSALLVTLLLANLIAQRTKPLMDRWIWPGLLAALALAYWFPFDRLQVSATAAGAIEIGIFSIPVLFAGLLFSSEFKKTGSPSAALNATCSAL